MHASLNVFSFWPDTTTNFRVICPCASEKLLYNVKTLAPSFLIGSSSFLQVRRTTMKSCERVRNLTRSDHGLQSYLPLSVRKNLHKLIMGEIM